MRTSVAPVVIFLSILDVHVVTVAAVQLEEADTKSKEAVRTIWNFLANL